MIVYQLAIGSTIEPMRLHTKTLPRATAAGLGLGCEKVPDLKTSYFITRRCLYHIDEHA